MLICNCIKIEEHMPQGPTIRIKRRPAAPAVQQETIVASIVEPAEPAIEVTTVRRLSLKPLTIDGEQFWLVNNKVYERQSNGARGAYLGRYDGKKIDMTADDSEDE